MAGVFARGRAAWIAAMVLGIVLAIIGLATGMNTWLIVVGVAFFLFGAVMLVLSLATKGQSDWTSAGLRFERMVVRFESRARLGRTFTAKSSVCGAPVGSHGRPGWDGGAHNVGRADDSRRRRTSASFTAWSCLERRRARFLSASPQESARWPATKTSKRPRAGTLSWSTRARQAPSGAKHVPLTMSASVRQAARLLLKTIAKRRAGRLVNVDAVAAWL